jgi:nucleoside-diphosphate-sugar epimerase
VVDLGIMGGSGQIARALADELVEDHAITLYTRRPEELGARLAAESRVTVRPLGEVGGRPHDVLINAAGPGDPAAIRRAGPEILALTLALDDLGLAALRRHPSTAYVYLSTGAIYANDYRAKVDRHTRVAIAVNDLASHPPYGLAKLAAESRHRAASDLQIHDLRIFGFLSRHLPLDAGFFVSELAGALASGEVFRTDPRDFVRDYVGPEELAQAILGALDAGRSGPCDVVSAAAVTKAELLEACTRRFGLRVCDQQGAPLQIDRFPEPGCLSSVDASGQLRLRVQATAKDIVLRELGGLLAALADPQRRASTGRRRAR